MTDSGRMKIEWALSHIDNNCWLFHLNIPLNSPYCFFLFLVNENPPEKVKKYTNVEMKHNSFSFSSYEMTTVC